jgi:DNA-binding transcriptional ArsR family regulator
MKERRTEARRADRRPKSARTAPEGTVHLTDPRALRAVAHPTRLALIGLLRRSGPLTATQAGERIGESAASCSFHLRQLAKWGLVEEAGGGRGRERPWRATAMLTEWAATSADPEADAATELLSTVVAERYFEGMMGWLGRRRDEPPEWREAVQLGDRILYLTADELAELGRRTSELAEPYIERTADPEARPEGARAVTVVHLSYPIEAEAGSS